MSDTIGREARLKSKGVSDIDFHRKRYQITIDDTESDGKPTTHIVRFVSPSITSYEQYRYYLLANSTKKNVPEQYFYRPDYMSFREYGTTNYWSLLLFLNNILMIEEFNLPEILVPTIQAISTINANTTEYNKTTVIDPSLFNDDWREKEKYPLYSPKPEKRIVSNIKVNEPVLSGVFYYHREQFTITNEIALKKYIDLMYPPNSNSVILRIGANRNFLYGVDYFMISSKGVANRLTWAAKDLPIGPGLEDFITEGMKIEVQYAVGQPPP